MVAPIGTGRAGAVEDNAGEKERHTVIVYSSRDGVLKGPEVLFEATDPSRPKDVDWKRLPTNVTANFPRVATYDE